MSLPTPSTVMPKIPNSCMKVRLFAVQAAIATAGIAVVPAPIVIALDVAGLDPVLAMQRRMPLSLGCEQPTSRSGSNNARRRAGGRNCDQRIVEEVARLAVHVANRTRYGTQLAKYAGRAIPIAGSILAALVAYRRTAALGFATLGSENPDSPMIGEDA